MRIGIDVRYLSHGLVGGVHTYLKNLVPALIDLATDHRLILYADTKRPFELSALPEHANVRYLPWRGGLSSFFNDVLMPRRMARDHLDVAHFPANYGFGPRGARTLITLHDALNLQPLPEMMRGLADSNARNPGTMAMMSYLHFFTRLAARRADLIVTDSAYARGEIARVGAIDAERIAPVLHAPPSDLRRIEDEPALGEVRRRYALTRPFVLADALKNPIVVVRAWRGLPAALRERFQIVFFSRRSDPLPIVREAVAAGHARLLVRPPREDLIALYSMAEIFIFPSWIEGFGLPVLEAMACGAPVIASNRGSIPEVADGAAWLIDAEDAGALAEHIQRVLGDPREAKRLRELGFARAAQFSWRNTAQGTLDAYQRARQLATRRDRQHAINP